MNVLSKIKALSVLLIVSLLTSCVAAVVAAAGMVYDRRSPIIMEADARIFHIVHKGIVTNPQFRNSHIEVSSFNRVVLLVGETPNASFKELAEKIARQTPGVRRVYDEISVQYPLSVSAHTEDSWITSQVRSFMLTKKGLESGSIRIVTENKVVYLMGIVTADQAELAVDVARRIKGVRKVVKIFQYIQ